MPDSTWSTCSRWARAPDGGAARRSATSSAAGAASGERAVSGVARGGGWGRSLGVGEGDDESAAARLVGLNPDAAVVGVHDLLADGQAKAGAAVAAPGRIQAGEALEDLPAGVGGHARPR